MAQVLAPIVQTTGTLTMPYTPSDGYQNASSQNHHSQQRGSQAPRNQMYNGHSSGTGYRGTSAPIAPYAFQTTPGLQHGNRSVSAPLPHGAHQQLPSHMNQARLGHPSHPSSSSDSTVSTSGSSNRSLVNPANASRDVENQKPSDSLAPSISLSTSVPDLSFSIGEATAKPSPGRYRRTTSRTDSSSSITTGSSTPTQRSTATVTQAQSRPAVNGELPGASKPGHNRASSADDSQLAQFSSSEAAKRYRRRSFNGLDADAIAANMASLQVGPSPSQTARQGPPSPSQARPASSSSRQGSRPASGHSHDRQGSAGSASSKTSSRSQVSHANFPTCMS